MTSGSASGAPGKGLSIAALALGAAAVVSSPLLLGGLIGLAGLALGIVALRRRHPAGPAAAGGVALSLAGVALSVLAALFYASLFRGQFSGRDPDRYPILRSEGAPAPALVVEALSGERLDLGALRGRRVVLNFWATWCAPCRAELPHLQRLSRESPSDDLVVVGISDEDATTIAAFARAQGIDYTLVSADREDLPAPFDGIRSVPTTIVVDRAGVMRAVRVGKLDYEELRGLTSDPS